MTDKEILNQCEEFYKELYSSKIDSCTNNYDSLFFKKDLRGKTYLTT